MAVPQQEFKPMTALPNTKQEAEVMRWGGLAGMFGAVLFVLVFAIVGVFVGADAGPEGAVMRFPDVRAARTVENGLYLVVLSLWAAHFLALFQALRSARLAPAMFGTGLGILGLTVLAVGAIPHAASVPISDLYHSPGVSSDDQATLVIVWQATQGVFNALLVTGLLIVPMSVIMLGVAMLETPAFGRRYGWLSVALGGIAAAAAIALLVDPSSFVAVIGIFALIVFHLVIGWKMYGLSRVAVRSTTIPGEGAATRSVLLGR
jgi:hypothetical protein